jgi:hypothetical protein
VSPGASDWILWRVLLFLIGLRSKGVGGGLFIVPTKIEPLGGRIHWTSPVRGLDKSSECLWKLVKRFWKPVPDRKVRWSSLEAGKSSLKASQRPD